MNMLHTESSQVIIYETQRWRSEAVNSGASTAVLTDLGHIDSGGLP